MPASYSWFHHWLNYSSKRIKAKMFLIWHTPYKNMNLLYRLVRIFLVTCNQDGDSDSLGKLLSNPCQCSFHFRSTHSSVTGFNLSATISWLVISHHMGFSACYYCKPLSYVYIQVDFSNKNYGGYLLHT